MIDTLEKRKPHRRKSFAAALLLGSSSLVSCAPSNPSVPSDTATCIYTEKSSEIIITTDQVIRCLGGVAVRGRAPKTGYSRDQFGNGWGTVEGCDTRNFILKRDLKNAVIENKCKVLSGILDDPYTGKTIPFKRGPDSSIVQIDHIESLSDAWQKGADTAHMSAKEREQLANDPKNLLAVYGPANDKKGDSDAAT